MIGLQRWSEVSMGVVSRRLIQRQSLIEDACLPSNSRIHCLKNRTPVICSNIANESGPMLIIFGRPALNPILPREATRSAVLPWQVVRPSVRLSVCDVEVS